MKKLRFECTGRWPVHFFRTIALTAATLTIAAAPTAVAAQASPAVVQARPPATGQSVEDFYRARAGYPLWLAPTAGDAADQLARSALRTRRIVPKHLGPTRSPRP